MMGDDRKIMQGMHGRASWIRRDEGKHADKKTKAHENRNLDGTYYSNAEREDVHREEKIIITEERTKHLNDLKQQILESVPTSWLHYLQTTLSFVVKFGFGPGSSDSVLTSWWNSGSAEVRRVV